MSCSNHFISWISLIIKETLKKTFFLEWVKSTSLPVIIAHCCREEWHSFNCWKVRKVITFHFSSLLHKNGFRHTQNFASRQIPLCDSSLESHKWNINFYFFSSSHIIIINNNKASQHTHMHARKKSFSSSMMTASGNMYARIAIHH